MVQLGSGADTFTSLRVRRGGNLYQAQKGNFGPQIGFAWSPIRDQGKLVLRGGFGMNYNQEEIAIAANGGNNPPSVTSPNFTSVSPTQINPSIVYCHPQRCAFTFWISAQPKYHREFQRQQFARRPGQSASQVIPSNVPTAYTYHYSLDTQYDLGRQWVATLGYQGSRGTSHHSPVQRERARRSVRTAAESDRQQRGLL